MAKDREQEKKITTYRERERSTRGMPENIRQVGTVTGKRRIYIEDYVTTYISQLAKTQEAEYAQAVLLGKVERKQERTVVYVSGAIHINEKMPEEKSAFSNEAWEVLYEEIKKYFDGLEIVGWVKCVEETDGKRVPEELEYIHQNQFSGGDKLLLLYNYLEKEMYFYVRSQGQMQRQPGYYIYYEKNEAMKNYRMDRQKAVSEEQEYEDTVLEGVRKKMVKHEQERARKTAYLAGGGAAIAVTLLLFLLATLQSSTTKISELEATIATMTEDIRNAQNVDSLTISPEKDSQDVSFFQEELQKDDTQETEEEDQKDGKEDDLATSSTPEASGEELAENSEESKEGEGNPQETGEAEETVSPSQSPDSQEVTQNETSEEGTGKNKNKKGKGKQTEADSEEAVETAQILGYYTVKKGDTLSEISYRYYNTVAYTESICQANEITDMNTIYEGQVLVLPKR